MTRALPWLTLLAACSGGAGQQDPFQVGLTVLYQTGQEDLFDGRDVQLVVVPPSGEPTVQWLGNARRGGDLSLPELPALAAGTRLGLLAQEPGGAKGAWDPARTVGYGEVVLEEDVAPGAALDAKVLVPALGDVGTLGSLPAARARLFGATTMLPDGRAYLFGGVPSNANGGDATDQILVLDGVDEGDDSFDPIGTKLPQTKGTGLDGDVSYTGRCDLQSTLLDDGRVLLTGGRPNYLEPWAATDQWLLFDPADESIADKGKLELPRTDHLALSFVGGGVLLFGGSTSINISSVPTYEIFDPDTGRSSGPYYDAAMIGVYRTFGARLGTDLVVCGGDYTDAAGGGQDWIARSACARIQPTGDLDAFDELPLPLSGAAMAPLPDGLLVVGGWTETVHDTIYGGYVQSVGSSPARGEVYRWTEGAGWQQVATLANPRAHAAAVPLADGRILIVGGDAEGGALFAEFSNPVRCPELFDPATNTLQTYDCNDTGSGAFPTVAWAPGNDVLVISGYAYPGGTSFDGLSRFGYTAFGPPLDPP